jgi:hypothetical protein
VAKIIEKQYVVSISKLVKDNEETCIDLPDNFVEGVDSIIQELIQDAALIVEVKGSN